MRLMGASAGNNPQPHSQLRHSGQAKRRSGSQSRESSIYFSKCLALLLTNNEAGFRVLAKSQPRNDEFNKSIFDKRLPAADKSIPRFINQLVLADPWHHAAQFFADFFDLVAVVHAADAFEAGCA